MIVGFASETLILSGAFFVSRGRETLGLVLMSLGFIGGLCRFLYSVSRDVTESNRKQSIYNDVKTVFGKILQISYESSIFETKRRNDTSVH